MSGAAIAVVARARARIVEHFVAAGATSAAGAIDFTPRDHRIDRRMFARMLAFGAVKAVEKGPAAGRYWLDEKRLVDFRKESLARVLGILAIAGFAAAGAIAFGG